MNSCQTDANVNSYFVKCSWLKLKKKICSSNANISVVTWYAILIQTICLHSFVQ